MKLEFLFQLQDLPAHIHHSDQLAARDNPAEHAAAAAHLSCRKTAELSWLGAGRLRLAIGLGSNRLEYETMGPLGPAQPRRPAHRRKQLDALSPTVPVAANVVPGNALSALP
jgi:hypothetical protein